MLQTHGRAPEVPGRRSAPLLALLLTGCLASTRVSHRVAPDRLGQAGAGRTARVYVLVRATPQKLGDAPALVQGLAQAISEAARKGDHDYGRELTPAEREALGRGAAKLFSDAGSHAAYQTVYADEPPPSLTAFAPTASLWIEPADPTVSQDAFDVKLSSLSTKTRYRARVKAPLRWKLLAEPERTVLASGRAGVEVYESDRDRKAGDLDALLSAPVKHTREEFLASLRTGLLPHTVHHTRTIPKGKGVDAQAYAKAKKGDWEGASALWTQSGDSVAHYNLGLYHERQGRWDQAREQYRLSAESGATLALTQMDALYKPGAVVASTSPFLQERFAVLPFENESVAVDAPEIARKKVFKVLQDGGYNLMPQAEVDEKLRGIGITDGGQLRMTLEGSLAQTLGAERMLFCTIEEFRVIDVGVYSRRQVKLNFRIVDSSGTTVWQNRGQTLDQSANDLKDAGAAFLTRLAVNQIAKTANVYLKEETSRAVDFAFEPLPRYLHPKK